MDNAMRTFEDALLDTHTFESNPPVRAIDSSAKDLICEVNRFKRAKRIATKTAEKTEASSRMKDSNGSPINSEAFGELHPCHIANPAIWLNVLVSKLENGEPIPKEIEQKWDLSFDYTNIGVWEQRHIKWQSAAQIYWFANQLADVETIKEMILRDHRISEFLDFHMLPSLDNKESRFRGLEDVIRKVLRRKIGRPQKGGRTTTQPLQLEPIPAVYNVNTKKINAMALFFTVKAVSKILALQKKTCVEIAIHPAINLYKSLAPPLAVFINIWINESLPGCS